MLIDVVAFKPDLMQMKFNEVNEHSHTEPLYTFRKDLEMFSCKYFKGDFITSSTSQMVADLGW